MPYGFNQAMLDSASGAQIYTVVEGRCRVCGYPVTVLARLVWDSKLRQGAEPEAVVLKELSLSGIQWPLYPGELGADAVEVFRFGDFAGCIDYRKAEKRCAVCVRISTRRPRAVLICRDCSQ